MLSSPSSNSCDDVGVDCCEIEAAGLAEGIGETGCDSNIQPKREEQADTSLLAGTCLPATTAGAPREWAPACESQPRQPQPFASPPVAPSLSPSGSRTLLRWCAHYLDKGGAAGGGGTLEVERGRWMACVAGSLFYLAIPIHREDLPLESVQR